jgi:glycosyltransferase involved in cell wall biosynthesis
VHIAFVTPESPYGDDPGCGVAGYLRAIIPAIAADGHHVTVIANGKREICFKAENECVSVRHFSLPSLHWYAARIPGLRNTAPLPLRQLEWSRAFYRQVASAAATTKIDVIESTEIGALFPHRIAPLVIRLHGSERVFREHSALRVTPSVRWNDALEGSACKRAAAITAPSKFHAREITKRRGWPVERVRVIPNPISADMLNAAATFHRNGHNDRIVLYTGRLAPVKGIETLLEAAKLVRAADPSITFVLAGPWQMPKAPSAYGINDQNCIRWLGPQTLTQLVSWYKRASVFVLPSNYESFGLSALEALAFGNAIVATDGTAISETLGDNGLVSFVPRRDPNALARAILHELTSTKRIRSHSEIQSALEPFTARRVASETLKLYQELKS